MGMSPAQHQAAMAAVETALLLRKVRRGEGHEEATGR